MAAPGEQDQTAKSEPGRNTCRFLHCADLHLGARYGMLPRAVADRRRADQRTTLSQIVTKAIDSKVQLFLLAGDVFDSPQPAPREVACLRTELSRLVDAGIRTFLIPGNHDPFDSPVWRREDFPVERAFLEPTWRAHRIEEWDLTLWGRAVDPARASENILRDLSWPEAAGRAIVLLHGSWLNFGRDEVETWAPFSEDDLRRLPRCYVALGHYHGMTPVLEETKHQACYPGTPEAIDFSRRELGPRHVLIGQIPEEGPISVRPEVVGTGRHEVRTLDCTVETPASLRRRLEGSAGTEKFLRAELTGSPSAELLEAIPDLQEELAAAFAYVCLEARFTEAPAGLEDSTYWVRFRDEIHRRMEIASEDEKPILQKALELGTVAFASAKEAPR